MKNEIINLLEAGNVTASQIARDCGVSRQYVHQIAKQARITPYRKPAKPPYQKKARIVDELSEQRKKYRAQKAQAAKRGIEFKLSFDEWWTLWEPHYANRGIGRGKLCMCRNLDSGAYEIGNVRIDRIESNGHDRRASAIAKNGTRWRQNWKDDGAEVAEALGFFNHHESMADPSEILERQQEAIDTEQN